MRELFGGFFAPSAGQNAAGLFGVGHFIWLSVTLFYVAVALYFSRRMTARGVGRTVLVATALFYVLELAKMAFSLAILKTESPNDLLPLYYCSLVLYMGPFAAHGSRVGKAFLAVGGLVGGAVFLLLPTTSLLRYPAFHFISLHSFLWHGTMVYLACLLWWRGGYRPQRGDALRVAVPVTLMCAAALIFNTVYNSFQTTPVANLMFLSLDFPGTPLSLLFHLCGKAYTPILWLAQAFLPYALLCLGVLLVRRFQQPKGN